MNIKTIIFDLGGVIIDLDESATFKAFADISNMPLDEVLNIAANEPFLKTYEKGLIDDTKHRDNLRSVFGQELTDEMLDASWNAMLGNIPVSRLNLLTKLKEKFHVAILSNTNHIHELAFNKILEQSSGEKSLHPFVDQVFFSHELNMRKPDLEIYQKALKLTQTKPADALFLDDKIENLQGAAAVGIQTMHIQSPDDIFKLNLYVE